jgi:hypothetical protein
MENRLKPQTEGMQKQIINFDLNKNLNLGVLKVLSNANIRTIMCTGMFPILFLMKNSY